MRTIKLRMDKSQHTRLKVVAAESGDTLGGLIRKRIESYPVPPEIPNEEKVYTTASLDDSHINSLSRLAAVLRSDMSGALAFILDEETEWSNGR